MWQSCEDCGEEECIYYYNPFVGGCEWEEYPQNHAPDKIRGLDEDSEGQASGLPKAEESES